MIEWIRRRLGKQPPVRHCRDCGAVVPVGERMCPRCHSMDIESGPVSAHEQKRSGPQ
jgi:predicted nucleic acid-binding Zn ribbon protein